MAATTTRDLVSRLAPTDPEGAAQLARSIDIPWFRAQALVLVGMRPEQLAMDPSRPRVLERTDRHVLT
jgi:hypothetical protein